MRLVPIKAQPVSFTVQMGTDEGLKALAVSLAVSFVWHATLYCHRERFLSRCAGIFGRAEQVSLFDCPEFLPAWRDPCWAKFNRRRATWLSGRVKARTR